MPSTTGWGSSPSVARPERSFLKADFSGSSVSPFRIAGFRSSGLLSRRPFSGGMNDSTLLHSPHSTGREKDASLRVKDRIVIGTADEDTVEEHCWEQTVFTPPWDILPNVHWGHE
jgi:hypothetical protein